MEKVLTFISNYLSDFYMPKTIRIADVVEIIIISFLVYKIMAWVKKTKAWSLLKGVLVIAFFIILAAIFQMSTILWIVKNVLDIAVIAVIVILQPELRRALELIGRKNIISSFLPFETNKGDTTGRFSDKTVNEIVKACVEMSKARTGALIVIEGNVSLSEYERTGIEINAVVSNQLIINIFEHNTPLHDGAVIVCGDRITAATCYLPLSDNRELGKELGTRHRAGVGISEETDSLTIIVSEETGKISIAHEGTIRRNLTADMLKEELLVMQNKSSEDRKLFVWKGGSKHEKKADE